MSRWINVKRRLPDLDVPVWCNLDGGGIIVGCRSMDCEHWYWCNTYDTFYRVGDKWCTSGAECDDEYIVTHWMPLPEPPKVKP